MFPYSSSGSSFHQNPVVSDSVFLFIWAVRMGQIIDNTSEGTSQDKCPIIKEKLLFELGFSSLYKHGSLSTSTHLVVEIALLFPPNTQTKAHWGNFN